MSHPTPRLAFYTTLLLMLLCSRLHAARSADYVWVEGEAPAKANVKWTAAGSSHADWLSGGKWLTYSMDEGKIEKELPDEGAIFEYAIPVDVDGKRELWTRIGFEFARSDFDWKIDGGEWKTVGKNELTSDLMELDFFAEAAWLKLGDVTLARGAHTLSFRLAKAKNQLGKYERVLFGLDCVCLSTKPFVPHSRYKPDENWRTPNDEKAAKQVFFLPFTQTPGERKSVDLSGTWEICRDDEQMPGEVAEPMKVLPGEKFWSAIDVPGDRNTLRPDLLFAHRLWYRTHVNITKEIQGRSFYLVFPQNNLNTTVYVNGVLCGFDKNPLARVQIDITKAIKNPGINEIMVGIRDAWYGRSRDPNDPMKLRRTFNIPEQFFHNGFQELAYPIWNHPESGILQPPTLVAAGDVYVSDVFVKPSVAKKQLAVEMTLANNTGKAVTADISPIVIGPTPELTGQQLANEKVTLAAGEQKTIEIVRDFANGKLWWPDDPALYTFRAIVSAGGVNADVCDTTFGYREWTIDGIHFKLNGVPFHGWCDQHSSGDDPAAWLAFQRKTHQQMMRFWGTTWNGLSPDAALDFFDKNGVVVRRSGYLDGEAIGYHADEPDANLRKLANNSPIKMDLMQNWRDQVCAQVRGERNHPSIMIWSIENEWLYINCINLYGGLMDDFEREVSKTSEAVQKLDPTRPTMSDGGAACKAQTLPVCGNHYITGKMNEYPALAYDANVKGGGRGRWEWDQKRPRFVGEDWFIAGNHPELATLGGEAALAGKSASLPAAGLVTRILQEGYRWADYGAWDFWMNSSDADGSQYVAFAPRAVLCKEWNWTFGSGARVPRTMRLFNDTHSDDQIAFTWTLSIGGKAVATQTLKRIVSPGTEQDVSAELLMPKVQHREEGEFILSLVAGGVEVFHDVKAVSVLPEINRANLPAAVANLSPRDLAYFSPGNVGVEVEVFLSDAGIHFTKIENLSEIPKEARVLLIAPNAITKDLETSPRLAAFAASGRAVVVLEQSETLRFQALPTEIMPSTNVGQAAFIEDAGHAIFAGLRNKDFFGGEIVYRNAYMKPTRGATSLLSCGDQLKNSALIEIPVDKGIMLLSQVGVSADAWLNFDDPAVRQLLVNLLSYAADYKLRFRATTLTTTTGSELAKAVEASGLKSSNIADPIDAISPGEKIAIIEATPDNLAKLAANLDKVKAFNEAGGWIVFNGLTPDGLASYNKIVGFEHMIRPFKLESVGFPPVRSPLTAGISAGDVTLYSSKRIFGFREGNYAVSDEFSYVVDYDEVAPFATSTFASFDKIVNGFTNADGWPLIINFPINADGSPYDVPMVFPKAQEFTEFTWISDTNYWGTTKVNLIFDGDKKTMATFNTAPNGEPQTFAINPPRTAKEVTLQIAGWEEKAGSKPLVGIDNIYLKVKRPAEFYKNVRPMLNIGGMMEYPRGKGGIVLCNLLFKETEEVPANAQKKRAVFAAILRNLKAPFTGGKTVIVGANLDYSTIDISKQANQYRTDRGWFGDKKFTFADLPIGKQTLAGVPYDIYEFATSPVPTAIMLGGNGVPNNLAKEVVGIPVHRKADALFFLQAARIDHRRTERDVKEGIKFDMARYVVHYADGKTETIPLLSEVDMENYKQEEPKALPGAQIAWTRKYEGTPFFAVAYGKQWNNPRPEAEIATVDLVYGPDKAGVPALLALTAASAK